MIATLEGILEYRGDNSVIINVGGIGFRVYVSGPTLIQLGAIKGKVSLYTHLHVREDNISLYGFASSEELTLFKSLISVTGIGTKLALALLSALNPKQLVMAIISGDIDLLSQTPGIGKKMASRLVVELKGKLEKDWKESGPASGSGACRCHSCLNWPGLLCNGGRKAISRLPDSEELSLEEKVKMALQQMARG